MKWICRLGVAIVVSLAPSVSAQTLRFAEDTTKTEGRDLSEAAADLFPGGSLTQEPTAASDNAPAVQEPVPQAENPGPGDPLAPPVDPPAMQPSAQDLRSLESAPGANSVAPSMQMPERHFAPQAYHGVVMGTAQQAFAGRPSRTWHLLNYVQTPQSSFDIWNGYADEAAHRRSHELRHVYGNCDCECLQGGCGHYGCNQQGVSRYAFGYPEQGISSQHCDSEVAKRTAPQLPTRITKQPQQEESPVAKSQRFQSPATQLGMPEPRTSVASVSPSVSPTVGRSGVAQQQVPLPTAPASRVAQPFPQLPSYPGNLSRR